MSINIGYVSAIAIIGIGLYWLTSDKPLKKEQLVTATSQQQNPNKQNIKGNLSRALYIKSVSDLKLSDKELEKCIIEEFGSSSKKPSHVSELKKLSCHADKIVSIEGIGALSQLESILIIGSNIQDATPLASINSLETIYLKGGNTEIRNIDSLTQLSNLRKITFPVMLETYCYEAEAVLKSMEENIDGPTSSNLNLVHCRGKKTAKVIRAITKFKQGKPLSIDEEIAVNDYEHNLEWSKP